MRPAAARLNAAAGLLIAAAGLLSAGVLVACSATRPPQSELESTANESTADDSTYDWQLPPGFPRPLVPADNPMSAAKVELGRHLFYDRRLSDTGRFACASCHRQELAFTDGSPRAIGATGEIHPRGAMSLANVAYNASFAWADPALLSLEQQARVPMFNRHPIELGVAGDGAAMIARLAADREYPRMFANAFPNDGVDAATVSIEKVIHAIASFERTLISGHSAYDRRVYLDDRSAMSAAAWRGMRLFFDDRLGCFKCHSGFNFSGSTRAVGTTSRPPDFHNTGLYNLGRSGLYPADNPGLGEHTAKPEDIGRFRAPTLRNIALTAPYMHDGSLATLGEVIDHYAAGGRTLHTGPNAGVGRDNPHKSPLVTGFALTALEKSDLIAFLHSLTDEAFITAPQFGDPSEATETPGQALREQTLRPAPSAAP